MTERRFFGTIVANIAMFTHKNELTKERAVELLKQEQFPRKTLSFYRYVKIEIPLALRNELFKKWSALGVLGRIYLAEEGINAQLNVPEPNFEKFVELLNSYSQFKDMPMKIAVEDGFSFYKLTIKVRQQIVADGLPADSYDLNNVGNHLSAVEWNQAMESPETIVVDMRNHYESRIGKFENAITPSVDTFREELPLVKEILNGNEDKKILLYCTGGVRCEKASAYLKHHGFNDVNQLYGGVISYAHQIKEEGLKSKFVGKNYVFDERTAEGITDDVLTICDVCKETEDRMVNCTNVICNLLFVQCEKCSSLLGGCCSIACNRIINLSQSEQEKLRKSQQISNTSLYKSRIKPNLNNLSLFDKARLKFRKLIHSLSHSSAATLSLKKIGKVRHFFVKAQIIEFVLDADSLKPGDEIVINGNTTKNFYQVISEIYVDGKSAQSAKCGDVVTIKVGAYVRKNDNIYIK